MKTLKQLAVILYGLTLWILISPVRFFALRRDYKSFERSLFKHVNDMYR